MKITLDLSLDSFHKYFGYELVGTAWFSRQIYLQVNGKEIIMQPSQITEDTQNGRVQINLEPYKSKEQIAAEESVAKAKEALKAAENALKVVKENK